MASSASKRSNVANGGVKSPDSKDKGKGKSAVASPDVSMEEGSEDDGSVELSGDEDMEGSEDEEMDANEEEDEEEEAESDPEIDPAAIMATNRRRKPRVDYTSKEALEKAGLLPEGEQEQEEE